MRLALHDYAGHAFTMELGRDLARRGHDVLYLYCPDVVGGHGDFQRHGADPPNLVLEGASIGHPFEKYSALGRLRDEWAYGRVAAARLRAFRPRAVISANAPLLTQAWLISEARRSRRRFVYWWQDSYGVGVRSVARRRWPLLAPVVAWPFEAVERWMLRSSDHVVAISDGLRDHARRWGVDPQRTSVVRNWAPVDEVVPGPVENAWKDAHGLAGRPLVVYSGTLGLKHNPDMLADLAARLEGSDALLVVASQGPGRNVLEERRRERGLENLVLLDYQPHDQFGAMLSAAEVLVAIIERDAAAFSVPSKVFSYLCAGRPVVASIPPENQAAEVLREADAGVCVSPDDSAAFSEAVLRLLGDGEQRELHGKNGRAWATSNFAVERVGDRFEAVARGPRGAGFRYGPVGVAAGTVRRIWSHPENRGRRSRAVATYLGWQVWERTVRRPWTVPLTANRRIRCHPHSPVAASVLYYRLPDTAEMRFVLDSLEAGDVFVDIGAHVGVYSVLASSVPGVRVVAVEPSSASFERLAENIELNGIGDTVTVVRAAAGDRIGQATLSVGADSMNAVVVGAGAGERVPLTTVDRLLRDLELTTVALMKVDVEGLELAVLAGAQATIERCRPALIVEVNDPEGIASFAERLGYTSVQYDGRGSLTPVAVEARDGRNALLVGDLDDARRRLRA